MNRRYYVGTDVGYEEDKYHSLNGILLQLIF